MLWTTPNGSIVWTISNYNHFDNITFNSDRYELVEKKDWKVKNLKSQIEAKKSKIENLDNIQINLIEQVKKAKDELKELEKELKNIE